MGGAQAHPTPFAGQNIQAFAAGLRLSLSRPWRRRKAQLWQGALAHRLLRDIIAGRPF